MTKEAEELFSSLEDCGVTFETGKQAKQLAKDVLPEDYEFIKQLNDLWDPSWSRIVGLSQLQNTIKKIATDKPSESPIKSGMKVFLGIFSAISTAVSICSLVMGYILIWPLCAAVGVGLVIGLAVALAKDKFANSPMKQKSIDQVVDMLSSPSNAIEKIIVKMIDFLFVRPAKFIADLFKRRSHAKNPESDWQEIVSTSELSPTAIRNLEKNIYPKVRDQFLFTALVRKNQYLRQGVYIEQDCKPVEELIALKLKLKLKL